MPVPRDGTGKKAPKAACDAEWFRVDIDRKAAFRKRVSEDRFASAEDYRERPFCAKSGLRTVA